MAKAISFENVGKLYDLSVVGTGTFTNDVYRWWKTSILKQEDPYLKIGESNDRSKAGNSRYVWALKDISFDIEEGDIVGIIGKNGAGKSTLLKLLSRVTSPTVGTIRAKGRIASLLEVGTGFHPELTGRENIYMNGAILGMTKQEIRSKLDEIIDFSGCERYIDTPVKRYSSGMMVRLGFAVAANLEPEIMVVDEVLAVGDAEFQKKAIGKMQDVSKGDGRTVLFVSHNMASVRTLCKSGILLKDGVIDYTATADECVDYYQSLNISNFVSHCVLDDKLNRDEWVPKDTRNLEFIEAEMLNDVNAIASDEELRFHLKIRKNKFSVKFANLGMHVVDSADVCDVTYSSPIIDIPDKDVFDISLKLKNHNLSVGNYFVNFSIGMKDVSSGIKNYDVIHNVLSFSVVYRDVLTKTPFVLWMKGWGNHYNKDAEIEVF
ncbi:MAG: ABC transporter ATP-binding protein [Paludibacteraceae bacterium]|nr:ABC transporter ATP-binding protein [Paludibacteraceae bacterium]